MLNFTFVRVMSERRIPWQSVCSGIVYGVLGYMLKFMYILPKM